jgi:hypothetical protein
MNRAVTFSVITSDQAFQGNCSSGAPQLRPVLLTRMSSGQAVDAVLALQIGLQRNAASRQVGEAVGGPLADFELARSDVDLGAGRHQCARDHQPDPSAAAGDQRCASLQAEQ